MRLFIFIAIGMFLTLHPIRATAMVRAGVEVDQDEDEFYDYEYDTWEGPGLYYGLWFDNEWDYDEWRDSHHHHGDGHRGREEGGHHGHGGGGHHH